MKDAVKSPQEQAREKQDEIELRLQRSAKPIPPATAAQLAKLVSPRRERKKGEDTAPEVPRRQRNGYHQ